MTKTICDICKVEDGPFKRVNTQTGIHPHGGEVVFEMLDYCPECLRSTALRSVETLEELKEKVRSTRDIKKPSPPNILASREKTI